MTNLTRADLERPRYLFAATERSVELAVVGIDTVVLAGIVTEMAVVAIAVVVIALAREHHQAPYLAVLVNTWAAAGTIAKTVDLAQDLVDSVHVTVMGV